jgi:hypothetical protein
MSWLTVTGLVAHERAYYHCEPCGRGHFPFDEANRLCDDALSSGLRPLVCKAAVLASFGGASADILRDFSGTRLSASSVRRAAEKAGAQLAHRQKGGTIACPKVLPAWDFSPGRTPEEKAQAKTLGRKTLVYLGLDAFSVPMQLPGGKKAPQRRMIYVGVLYPPGKEQAHYLADFDLAALAAQMRRAAESLGLGRASQLVAISDAGNGLEEALRRNFNDGLVCILDWYHAAQHLHDYSKCLHADEAQARAWAERAKTVLWEDGGRALGEHLREQEEPLDGVVAEQRRKLVNYFADNEHRTDYPKYREQGLDVGSGPTEAACKIVGMRMKGSGMRWVEGGAASIAPLRALYLSGDAAWRDHWSLAA